jgi:hypothetical protein
VFEDGSCMSDPKTSARIRRSHPDISAGADPLWESIDQAVRWCAKNSNPKQPRLCFRREETRPRTLERDYFTAVSSVTNSPHRFTRASTRSPRSLNGGRLLVYFPDDDLADGAAEAESDGFFDVHNAPPWDTWVGIFEDSKRQERNPYLLSWVPPAFVDRAQRGIDVNPEECILWLNDCDVVVRQLLRR